MQNIAQVDGYISSLKENKLPILRGHEFRAKDKIYGTIIKELMCYLSVDLNQVAEKFEKNVNLFLPNIKKLQPFVDTGCVNFENHILSIKPEARPLVRNICSVFDQYFKPEKNKYSFGI